MEEVLFKPDDLKTVALACNKYLSKTIMIDSTIIHLNRVKIGETPCIAIRRSTQVKFITLSTEYDDVAIHEVEQCLAKLSIKITS